VEKLASKSGVVQNSVKDVLAMLTDDQLVDMDKIGATNYFWSFPSKETAARKAKLRGLKHKTHTLTTNIAQLHQHQADLLKDRPVSQARSARLHQLEDTIKRRKELQDKLAVVKDNDPAKARQLEDAVKRAKQGVERWVNNAWAIVDWLKKSHGLNKQQAQKQLGIDDDFDVPVYGGGKR
jgi:hypothetical protein